MMSAISFSWRMIMTANAVALRVTPSLDIECKFCLRDDGWSGVAEQPSITVQAATFEQAKADMESALGKHIRTLFETSRAVSKGQTA
jgi:predicted RNase H-like HicB family nuclease